jgi:hypothetical protein
MGSFQGALDTKMTVLEEQTIASGLLDIHATREIFDIDSEVERQQRQPRLAPASTDR